MYNIIENILWEEHEAKAAPSLMDIGHTDMVIKRIGQEDHSTFMHNATVQL